MISLGDHLPCAGLVEAWASSIPISKGSACFIVAVRCVAVSFIALFLVNLKIGQGLSVNYFAINWDLIFDFSILLFYSFFMVICSLVIGPFVKFPVSPAKYQREHP